MFKSRIFIIKLQKRDNAHSKEPGKCEFKTGKILGEISEKKYERTLLKTNNEKFFGPKVLQPRDLS